KLKRRKEELEKIDFFGAPGRKQLETLMTEIDRLLSTDLGGAAPLPQRLYDLKGRIWVTRRGVKVDRIACAWLIRRYIDPAAKFLFVDPDQHSGQPGEVRFDMFDGEFTHRGDLCTFEVLLEFLGAQDAGLQAIAQMVHDIDVKDSRYQRAETAGLAALINGIVLRHPDDARRLEEGAAVYDSMLAQMSVEAAL